MTDRTASNSDARKRKEERDDPALAPGWRSAFWDDFAGDVSILQYLQNFKPNHDHQEEPMTDPTNHRATADRLLADAEDMAAQMPPHPSADGTAIFACARYLAAVHDTLLAIHADSKPRFFVDSERDTAPAEVTEEPPIGTYLVDRDGDVWERGEGGWRLTGVETPDPFEEVTSHAPLRLATPADLARVGIEDEPAPADDLPGEPVEPCGRDVGDATYCPCLLPRLHDGLHSCKHTDPAPADDLPGDEDRDEALAKELWDAFWGDSEPDESWEHNDDRVYWLNVARTARKRIEDEQESRERTVVDEWDDMLARAEKAERALDNATQRVLALTAERDKWNTLAHEADRNAKRHHARATKAETERDEWKARHEALREDVETRWAFVDDNFLKDILHSILKGDDERAKGEQR